ncbi:hypothetical protein MPSEU_001050700 [Mayamaea pseudoterrestris]|nr:hypothetical protein MPSEU_001050700 [Mayamaea pseudoterrestris]
MGIIVGFRRGVLLLLLGTALLREAFGFCTIRGQKMMNQLRFSPSNKPRRFYYATPIFSLRLPQHDKPINCIAAPMVAASDYAFRCLCRQYGVDLTFTQMLHTENLLKQETFRRNHLDLWEYTPIPAIWSREQREFLEGSKSMDDGGRLSHEQQAWTCGPVIVQLAGHDPVRVVEVAELVLEHTGGRVHGFDLNLGCPQGIARKGRYGAHLMDQDPLTACAILSALRQSLPDSVSVSAKIRLPEDPNTLPKRIIRILDTGVDFITIHGRTIRENKVAVVACHFDQIARVTALVSEYDPTIPVVANGGIEQFSDVERVRQLTNAAAVMSSEALLENPGVFALDSSLWSSRQVLNQQFLFASEYLNWCQKYPPLPGVLGQSCNIVRGHLFKILFRYLSEQPDLREKMASQHIRRLADFQQVCEELHCRYNKLSDEELDGLASSRAGSSWYRRHWSAKRIMAPLLDQQNVVISTRERKEAALSRITKLRQERLERNVVHQ